MGTESYEWRMERILDMNKEWYDVVIIDSGIGEYSRLYQDNYTEQINFIFDEYGVGKIFKAKLFTGIHVLKVLNTMEKYRKNNRYRYHNFNIVNKNGKSSSFALLKALEYLLEQDEIDIVMACLSYDNTDYHYEIQKCCSRLREKGKIIFMAENYRYDSISNYLNDVIMVKGGMYKTSEEYGINLCNENQICGNILPEFIPMKNQRYALFGGTSMATAKIASMLSLCYLQGDIQKIYNSGSLNEIKDLNSINYPSKKWVEQVWEMIVVILREIGEPCRLEDRSNCSTMELIKHKEKYDLLIGGLNRWCVEWKLEKINYYDFGTIYSIARWFEESEKKYIYNF